MPVTNNRKIKKEIIWWIQSNLKIILKLLNVRVSDFAKMLGTSRQWMYMIFKHEDAINGRWVLSIFYVLDDICANYLAKGKEYSQEYKEAIKLMIPMAYYRTHITGIYED